MKNNQNIEIESVDIGTPETLASEMYRELKRANVYKEKVIKWLCIIIGILIVVMGFQGWYHTHMWSQFDTVVVDSGEGSGNANYVQGDNQGGIYNNGESSGQEKEIGQDQVQGDPGQA